MSSKLNIYCDESTHLPNDGMPYMVLGALTCPIEEASTVSSAMRALREKHGLPSYFEVKWNKISPSQIDFYLDLVDFFFDSSQLNFRCVVAPKGNLDHQRFHQTHDEWYYKMAFILLKKLVQSSGEAYIYLDKKDTNGAKRVRDLQKYLANSQHDFAFKKVRRIQIVESHHVTLLQLSDFLLGAVNYANRGLDTSQSKLEILRTIERRAGLSLTSTTEYSESKFDVFVWRPQRSSRVQP